MKNRRMMFIPLKINQKEFGLGRVGVLDKPVRLSDFVQQVKEAFQLDGLVVIAKDATK